MYLQYVQASSKYTQLELCRETRDDLQVLLRHRFCCDEQVDDNTMCNPLLLVAGL